MPRTIAFVPVRGGSKSIPKKNIKPFFDKPLVYWVLNALAECPSVDEIVLATDDQEIVETVASLGLSKIDTYIRNPENARDHSSTESVMLEFLDTRSFADDDIFILAQATSPFTTSADFENAIALRESSKSDSLLSCAIIKRFFWTANGEPINYDMGKRPRRQDFQGELMENGALYINSIGNIKLHKNRLSGKVAIYEMPEHTGLELDEPSDWLVGEALMRKHHQSANSRKDIKLFLTDVDGVLTDAGMYYGENAEELKKFNTKDGKGIELLRNAGIKTGIITSENTQIVANRAKKLKVDYLYQGIAMGKLKVALEICDKEGLGLDEVAYIGDDINDLDLLLAAGLCACPADAVKRIKTIEGIYVLQSKGGEGAVREFVDTYILSR